MEGKSGRILFLNSLPMGQSYTVLYTVLYLPATVKITEILAAFVILKCLSSHMCLVAEDQCGTGGTSSLSQEVLGLKLQRYFNTC